MRPFRTVITAVAAGLIILPPAGAQVVNGIRAIVHDSIITSDDVERATEQTAAVLRSQLRNQPSQLQKKMDEARQENLEKLLTRKLILHEFNTAGYTLPESVIDEIVSERIQERFGRDRVTLTKSLHAQGLTIERFRQQVRDQFVVDALRQKNVSAPIIISPHKVESYYLAHREEYKVEDEVKVRILVLTKSNDPTSPDPQKLAEEILTKLKDGATFTEMVTVYSQEARSTQEGKWYERNQLTKGLADIVFNLEAGQHSGVLSRTAGEDYWVCQYENGRPILARHYGVDSTTRKENMVEELKLEPGSDLSKLPAAREFFLILVEDKRAAHYKSLGEIRELIEKTLKDEEQNRLEKQWVERLKKKTFVRYF